MLEFDGIHAGYGQATILRDVSVRAEAGQILCTLGRNGAGKTTLMKAIMGLVRVTAGHIALAGEQIASLPAHQIPRRGIGYVPQGRRLFGELSVAENLTIGLMARPETTASQAQMLELFPALADRLDQRADTLSGGEQQMLAMARALCLSPKLLLLDEPTEGLQPSMIDQIRRVVTRMRDQGVAVVMVEQRIDAVLSIADRVVFLENGKVAATTDAASLRANPDMVHRYIGL
ncbi:MAG: ABC transporter ATP-binding protein [Pseudomonadota bacterium]